MKALAFYFLIICTILVDGKISKPLKPNHEKQDKILKQGFSALKDLKRFQLQLCLTKETKSLFNKDEISICDQLG